MTPTDLADRIKALDWSACSLPHQLAVSAAVETLRAPAAPTAAMARWTRLLHLDGRPFASTCGIAGDDRWAWIVETVAHELECPEDSVGCLETDDGDVITVDGLPAYRVE